MDAFVKPAEAAGEEEHVPKAIIDRFNADVLLKQGVTDGHAVGVPADAAVAADPADFKVAGIVRRGEAHGVGPW